MKRNLLIVFVFCFAIIGNSQNLTSKKGVPILPQKGDCALGVNAVPFLNYVGNFFNNTVGNTTSFNFTNPYNAIYAKYFLDDNTALRARIRIGNVSTTQKAFVMANDTAADKFAKAEDSWKNSVTNIGIAIGCEKRRGHGRAQGYYGAELGIGLQGMKDTYKYGNEISTKYPSPPRTSFNNGDNVYSNPQTMVSGWVLEKKQGSTFSVGVRGFVGVEYFFAPKISVAGEFGWGIGIQSMGEGSVKYEYFDSAKNKQDEKTDKVAGGSKFYIDTDNLGGAIVLLVHI